MFIGRETELSLLDEAWATPSAGLLIVHGRRRVGKTELLRRFAADRRRVFYVATQSSNVDQLRSFSAAVREGLGSEASGVALSAFAEPT